MEENKICEKTSKCPIYSGILKSNEMMTQTYKNLYCEAGEIGRKECKRFQVAKVMGSCPPNILPNTKLTIEEIIEKMKSDDNSAYGNSCS